MRLVVTCAVGALGLWACGVGGGGGDFCGQFADPCGQRGVQTCEDIVSADAQRYPQCVDLRHAVEDCISGGPFACQEGVVYAGANGDDGVAVPYDTYTLWVPQACRAQADAYNGCRSCVANTGHACSPPAGGSDGGAPPDGGARFDGGALFDGGARPDAGARSDAGMRSDAGPPPDAGRRDAGPPPDAAPTGSCPAGNDFCPARGGAPAGCWPAGVQCNTVVMCPDGPLACANAASAADCATGGCVAARTREACDDQADNDFNGFIDCADFACLANPSVDACRGENTDDACSDGRDDDGNGYADCRDLSCLISPAVTVCGTPENSDALCGNHVDDDGDGHADCDDRVCRDSPFVTVCRGAGQ